jgi:hypothetical protein
MADWTDILNSEVDTDSPITEALMTALRDNPVAIAEGASGAPQMQTGAYADGSVTLIKIGGITAGDYIIGSNDAIAQTNNDTYEKLKEFYNPLSGVLRVYFELRTSNASYTAYGRIYINGAAVGTERTTNSTSYVPFVEDLSVEYGDLIQLYAHKTTSAIHVANVQNFRLESGNPIIPVAVL